MKKLIYSAMMVFAVVSMVGMAACGGNDGPDPSDDPGNDPPVVNEGNSIQYVNKLIDLPAANMPQIDRGGYTEFTLEAGKYLVEKNGQEIVITNQFSTGIVLEEGDELVISQGGEEVAFFAPEQDAGGVKVKLEGVGNTQALTTGDGVGRGIYTIKMPDSYLDANGQVVNAYFYRNGDVNDQVSSYEFEGGVPFLIRPDFINAEHKLNPDGTNIQGFVTWLNELSSYNAACNDIAISFYKAEEYNKAVSDQVPFLSFTSKTGASTMSIACPLIQKTTPNDPRVDDYDHSLFTIQGMGNFTVYLNFYENVTVTPGMKCSWAGLDDKYSNPNGFTRVFTPDFAFKFYVCVDPKNYTESERATPAQVASILYPGSDGGMKLEGKSFVFALVDGENTTNTGEPMALILTPDGTNDNIASRLDGLKYDTESNTLVLLKDNYMGVTFRGM